MPLRNQANSIVVKRASIPESSLAGQPHRPRNRSNENPPLTAFAQIARPRAPVCRCLRRASASAVRQRSVSMPRSDGGTPARLHAIRQAALLVTASAGDVAVQARSFSCRSKSPPLRPIGDPHLREGLCAGGSVPGLDLGGSRRSQAHVETSAAGRGFMALAASASSGRRCASATRASTPITPPRKSAPRCAHTN